MERKLKRPTNPYDPLWGEYREQNPGLRLSLSAAAPEGEGEGEGGGTAAPDLSFVPETFKGEDGTFDTGAFRASYDELSSFKSQADEASAMIPSEAAGYEFKVPEGHVLPEGFDAEMLVPVMDAEGNPKLDESGNPVMKQFDVNDMIDANDPDLPLIQEALHEAGAKPELMGKIASILANREVRNVMRMNETAKDETKALGPEGQSRIDHVARTVTAMIPANLATAVNDSITSADALRGMEELLKSSTNPTSSTQGKEVDNATASIDERIMAGLKKRESA